jgi:hypothetical protein
MQALVFLPDKKRRGEKKRLEIRGREAGQGLRSKKEI